MPLCSRDRRRNQADQRQRPKKKSAEMNEHHGFPLAVESVRSWTQTARESASPGFFHRFRISDSCMSCARTGSRSLKKLTGRDLSFLFKKAQQPDRKGPLVPVGVAARSSLQFPCQTGRLVQKPQDSLPADRGHCRTNAARSCTLQARVYILQYPVGVGFGRNVQK